MARKKNAPALFDVIHRDVRQRSPLHNHRTPLTWIRERMAARQAARGTVALVTEDDNDPTLRPHPLMRSLGIHEVDSDRLPPSVALAPPPAATIAPSAPAPVVTRPYTPPVQVDRSRQVIRFSLSYTNAGVAAFSLLVALSLAYYVGRTTATAAADATATAAVTTEQLRAGPANPSVLDVAPAPRATVGDRVSVAGSTPPAPPAPAAAAAATDGKRIVGMNYVIIQSYPEQEDARQAAEILRQHGVPATVVKGTAFAPRWYSVVGTQPFDRLSNNPEYAEYVKRIKQISEKLEKSKSGFKKFEPRPYQWRDH